MVISRYVRSVEGWVGVPAHRFSPPENPLPESPLPPAAPKAPPVRPPLHLVPPLAPEAPFAPKTPPLTTPPPATRISPLWLSLTVLTGIILGPGDTSVPRYPEITDLPLSDTPPPSPEETARRREELEAELAQIEGERRRHLFNGDFAAAQRLNARIQAIGIALGCLPQPAPQLLENQGVPVVNATNNIGRAGETSAPAADATGSETDTNPSPDIDLANIAERLKSPQLRIQWVAWKELYNHDPEAARRITEADLGPGYLWEKGRSGLPRFMWRDKELFHAVMDMFDSLNQDRNWDQRTLNLEAVHPSHCLWEFSPSGIVATSNGYAKLDRRPYRQVYLGYLRDLLARMDPSDPQAILGAFVVTNYYNKSNQYLYILQTQSGKRIILDGHHRIAALLDAVYNGLVPRSWLEEVPVKISEIASDFPIPESLFFRFIAPTHELTIWELLPPKT